MTEKGKHAGVRAGLFGGARAITGYAVAVLIASAVAALALVVPLWAAALIVGITLLVAAAVTAWVGRGQAKQAAPLKPDEAVQSLKTDINEVKARARRS